VEGELLMGGDLSLESLQKDVAHAVDDVRQALITHDYSKVIEDLQDDLKKRGPKDNGFEQSLDKALHDQGLLPKVFVEGLDGSGNVVFGDVRGHKFALDKQGKTADGHVPVDLTFPKVLDHFHPVRPPGIGGWLPGLINAKQSSDQDWRSGKTTSNADGSNTYEYKGQLAWAGQKRDVDFTGSEKIDAKGSLLESHVKYDKPINQTFLGPSGDTMHYISNVRQIDSTMQRDGSYVTVITTSDRQTVTFATNSDGKILKVQ